MKLFLIVFYAKTIWTVTASNSTDRNWGKKKQNMLYKTGIYESKYLGLIKKLKLYKLFYGRDKNFIKLKRKLKFKF